MLDGGTPMERLFQLMREEVRVCGVAEVISYTPGEPTAHIRLLVQEDRNLPGGRTAVPSVDIEGVPVLWPVGGARALTWGLRAGDKVLALYRHRSHDEIDSGDAGPLVPALTRRMNPSDVVVLVGFVAPDTGLESSQFRSDGQPVMGLPNGEALHVGDSAANYVLVREDLLQAELSKIHTAVNGHTHLYTPGTLAAIQTGPGASYAAPGATSSSRIKVDD